MIQDIAPKRFDSAYVPSQPEDTDTILFYRGRRCLMHVGSGKEVLFPRRRECPDDLRYTYLFRIDDEAYYLAEERSEEDTLDLEEKGFAWEDHRIFRTGEPRDRCFAGITGLQLEGWYRRHRFCGTCGAVLTHDKKERMMRCPECGELYYPQIAPAVIIGVTHHGRLLMSRYRDRAYKNYALLAGFNEIGESIEETVHREVLEEVGLPVKNLQYYKSQPWAFSDSLLMGFFCELDGYDDEITLEEDELVEAGWYLPSEIPEEMDQASLTSEMMRVFREYDGVLPDHLP